MKFNTKLFALICFSTVSAFIPGVHAGSRMRKLKENNLLDLKIILVPQFSDYNHFQDKYLWVLTK